MTSPVKTIRDELRLTQEQLANILGVGRQMIYFYEKGKHQPSNESIKTLIEMAKKNNIKINVEDFFL